MEYELFLVGSIVHAIAQKDMENMSYYFKVQS